MSLSLTSHLPALCGRRASFRVNKSRIIIRNAAYEHYANKFLLRKTNMVEEAGGTVSRMDGGKFCVFDRSVLVSNGVLHGKLLDKIGPATEELKGKGIDFSLWYKPEDYTTDF
ncbi:unnamed protein product [Vicia faba]|uniref:Uncharacterized protein n=1 Tax=Vicia faba TaxID=3906 RepID=A0AAV0YP59_VICFA|nr:unnamed protein product [Vicia faba]